MFTSDDYFNITNAHILNENVNHLDERKYEPDEKLPGSGKTPDEKMQRAQGKHGAHYMTTQGDVRRTGAKNAHHSRGAKVKKIKDIIKSGGDPRNDSSVGVGYGNDARKIGRPGVSAAERSSKTRRDDDANEKSAYTQGGLRAHQTKAGGYRSKTKTQQDEAYSGRRRENDEPDEATQFAQSDAIQKRREASQKAAAKAKLKSQGLKRKDGSSVFESVRIALGERRENDEPSGGEQLRQSDRIAQNPKVKAERERFAKARSEAGRAKLKSQGLKRKDGSSVFESVVEHLFVEGYADSVENAETMAMNISETWVNQIIENN
jgi:hypothetical protein